MAVKGSVVRKRDGNILKAYRRELDLKTRIVKCRKAYNRKQKHKGATNDSN